MNRDIAKGFSIGVFAPITAFVIYVGFYLEVEFDTAIDTINRMGTMTHHISLSVFLTNTVIGAKTPMEKPFATSLFIRKYFV